MANSQLFYGKLSAVSPLGNGNNSVIRVRFDATTSSKVLTNITPVSGYAGIELVRAGQMLVESSAFPTGTDIVSIDTINNTITVADFPATNESQGLARVSPSEGEYYVASASFFDPQGLINLNNITGSAEVDFNGEYYSILGKAADPVAGTEIPGRFHLYNIKEVLYRNVTGNEGSFYLTWGEDGTEADSGDALFEGVSQVLPIVELSPSQSLGPIFAKAGIAGITDLPAGSEVAAYQIALNQFYDAIVTGSHTSGSLFPYTGDAEITGSLTISGSDNVLNLNSLADVTAKEEYLFSGSDATNIFTIDRTQYLGYSLDYLITDENDSQRVGTFRAHFPSTSNVMFDDTCSTFSGTVVGNVALAVVNGTGNDIEFRISRIGNDTDIKIIYFRKLFKR
jgi:hypothetical protein